MPIYEFTCDVCGCRFEELMPAREEKTPPCAECGSESTRRAMSAAAIRTTGAGPGAAMPAPASSCTPRGGFS